MYFSTLVLKNLLRRRCRTSLTCLGIAVAIGSVVALVGIARGFERNFVEAFEGRGVDVVVVEGGLTEQLTSSLDEGLIERFRALPQVAKVSCMLLEVLTFEKENLMGVMVQGWPGGGMLFDQLTIKQGRTLIPGEQNTALLGSILAKNMKKKVGDTIEIDREDFTIVGIFDSFNIFENGSCIVLLNELQRVMMRPKQVTAFAVVLRDGPDKPALIAELCQQVETFKDARGRRLRLSALPTRDYVSNTLQIRLAHAMAWATSAIALIIGSIGMLNTMMTSVLERTREIGILRAIGWKQRRVMQMVLSESVLLGMIGALLGCVGAAVLLRLLTQVPGVEGFISGDLEPAVMLQGLLLAAGVGVVGGLYPAWQAGRLSPVEAIRHE
jgi:putative ABC transport system permease protein